MLKKTVFVSLTALALSAPALAIEMPADAEVGFNSLATGYPSYMFNDILEAYGLTFQADKAAGVPSTYATVADGEAFFNNHFKAYTPKEYHAILTAYGLELSPEMVREKLWVSSYAKEAGGDVIVGEAKKVAYNGREWENILSAYSLPKPPPVPVAMPMDSDGDGVIDERDRCPNTPAGVKVNEEGCWVHSSKFLFDFDKAVVKEEYYPVLDDTKRIFDNNPDLKVTVEGHTDSVGSEAYNQGLSERRAQAVVDYLVNEVGIESYRLDSVGYGEARPAYSNDTKEGRAKNRRVEFTTME